MKESELPKERERAVLARTRTLPDGTTLRIYVYKKAKPRTRKAAARKVSK